MGALRALLQAGIVPELIVGASAGAINGAFLAASPTLAMCDEMASLWMRAGKRKLIAAGPLQVIKQLARGADYISHNRKLKRYARMRFPGGRTRFGDLQVPFYAAIMHLQSHTLWIYGDDKDADVVDAIGTSSAVPGFFPPDAVGDELFVDGGSASPLPVRVAVARGATEIYALDIAFDIRNTPRKVRGSLAIGELSGRPTQYKLSLAELEFAQRTGVPVHHIALHDFPLVALGDFSNTQNMIESGERVTRAYLAAPTPGVIHYPHRFTADELPKGPPGARPFLD